MNLLVIHLSDIHFQSGRSNPLIHRATALANAAHSAMPDAEAILLAIVGDIAFKGISEEYDIARNFLSSVIKSVRARNKSIQRFIVATVPGNHDCDLSFDQSARDKIMADLNRDEMAKPSVFDTLIAPQKPFFEFSESIFDADVICPERPGATSRILKLGGFNVEILCINSALCTRISEQPGTLHIPSIPHIETSLHPDAMAASIVLVHHPPHWLSPESYHALRSAVTDRQAILLTGHEHQPGLWTTSRHERLAQLIEGGVLQDSANADTSSFHTLAISLKTGETIANTFVWRQTVYVGSAPQRLANARPNAHPSAVKLSLQPEHLRSLDDLGHVITHPARDSLSLSDIFHYPNLSRHPGALSKSKERLTIRPDRLLADIFEFPLSQINSPPRGGRTALAKRMFYDMWSIGTLPLLMSGENIRSISHSKLREKINEAIKKNYNVNHPDEYTASGHKLILLIDDFQLSPLQRTAQNELIAYLRKLFDHIVIFDRKRIDLEELVVGGKVLSNLQDIVQYDILPFGSVSRAEFVERWVLIGKTPADPEVEIRAEVVETTKLVETLLGRDLVPRTPFYILSLLSALQHAQQPSADLGSLGYLYDLLIRTSIAKATRQPDQMQTFDRFLADLAYGMYKQSKSGLPREEFKAKCQEYADRCIIEFDDKVAEDILKRAMILSFEAGHVRFRYKYLYLFFVAKYLSQRLSGASIQKEVASLAEQLDRSESANVLLFLCHCTSDPIIISSITDRAAALFAKDPEVDLAKDVAFLNSFITPLASPLNLGSNDAVENRRKLLEQEDAADEQTHEAVHSTDGELRDQTQGELGSGDRRTALNRELTSALKVLEIAGQILRNHPAIEGVHKMKLLSECSCLVRRMLGSLFGSLSHEAPALVAAIEASILEKRPGIDPSKARLLSSNVFQFNIESVVVGVLGAYAGPLGISGLSAAFRRLRLESPDSTTKVLLFAVQLENPREFPETDAIELEKLFKDNGFIWNCLRALVFVYYYLFFEPDRKQKQRMCQKFGINYQLPAILSSEQKRNI